MANDFETVKKLRSATGAGIMACQKAVQEANGDYEKAFDILRQKGIAKAMSKADRDVKDGLCGYLKNGNDIVMLKIACETDFVARSDKFKDLVESLLNNLMSVKTNDVESFLNAICDGRSIKDILSENIAIIGENIVIQNVAYISLKENESCSLYIHNKSEGKDNLGRMAICTIASCDKLDIVDEILKNISLHIAASFPIALDETSIDVNTMEREKAIYKEQIAELNKPDDVANRMLEGKIKKFYEENVLLKQVYVLDSNSKVEDVIQKFNKENSCELKLVNFYRFAI